MNIRLTCAALGALMLAMPGVSSAQPQSSTQPTSANPVVAPEMPKFTQTSANVYRRFPEADTPKMVEFYDKVLALRPLQPIQLSAQQQMILFGIGSGQIKLAAGLKEDRKIHLGEVNEGIGIRLFTLEFPDEAALVGRFKAAGYPAPTFKDIGGGKRAALVKDPAGFSLELVIAKNPSPGVNVGINVSDLKRGRAFYREFVGLKELPPVKDALLGVTKYPFKQGETTISLWSVGKNLPADTGSAGIQYVIGNVDAINAMALEKKVTVETPLGGLPNFGIRFVWLNDPDGVTNYFAQPGPPRRSAAAQ